MARGTTTTTHSTSTPMPRTIEDTISQYMKNQGEEEEAATIPTETDSSLGSLDFSD